MSIDKYMLDIDSNTKNANMIKDMVLDRLRTDGLITKEQATEYMNKWQMILIKASWFKRWMNAFNREQDGYYYKLVKFED